MADFVSPARRRTARQERWGRVVAVGCAALVLVAVFRAAWLCDDAFITLRTVDNWVNGYGLRWNVSERVQSFTHPAWMVLVALAYLPGHNATFALLAPALLLTCASVLLIICMQRDGWLAAGGCLLLLSSKAFIEFSTSGLENSLVHVLLLGYARCLDHTFRTRSQVWWVLGFAALLLCARIDLVWLIAPSLFGAMWLARVEWLRPRAWLAIAPLLAWELFALLYYGFALPNTAYAKLNTGVPLSEAVGQGVSYLRANLIYDSPTLLSIGLSSAFAIRRGRPKGLLLALGVALWIVYLVRIGGDFMLGRLLTPAMMVSVVLWLDVAATYTRTVSTGVAAIAVIGAVLLPRSALLGAPRWLESSWLPEHVTDERACAYGFTGLFRDTHREGLRAHPFVVSVLSRIARGERVLPARSIGFAGYFAGPAVHIVDEFALADPLLARLPADPAWRPGHFARRIPAGYLATLQSGRSSLAELTLANRYRELVTIIRDPLLSASRLWRIVQWNLRPPSMYPPDYEVRHVNFDDVAGAPGEGASVRANGVLVTDRQGLALVMARAGMVQRLSLALGRDDRYLVAFRLRGDVVWKTWLEPLSRDRFKLGVRQITAPQPLEVDSVLIQGRCGDYRYHVGGVAGTTAGPQLLGEQPS